MGVLEDWLASGAPDAPGPGVDAIAALHFADGGTSDVPVPAAAAWPPTLEVTLQPTPGVPRDAAAPGPARLTSHTFALEHVDSPRLAHYRERAPTEGWGTPR